LETNQKACAGVLGSVHALVGHLVQACCFFGKTRWAEVLQFLEKPRCRTLDQTLDLTLGKHGAVQGKERESPEVTMSLDRGESYGEGL
jgi:hypothetical protein